MKYTVEGNTLKLQIEDSPIFKIIKKDGETNQVIANTKFAIYNMQNESEPATNSKGEILGSKETINGKEYYTLTTNEKGEITADLQEGEYKAIEIQAPKQYQVLDKAYYFAIGSLTANTGLKAEKGITVGEGNYNSNFQVIETEDNGYLVNNDGELPETQPLFLFFLFFFSFFFLVFQDRVSHIALAVLELTWRHPNGNWH